MDSVFSIFPLINCDRFGVSSDQAAFFYSSGTNVIIIANPYHQRNFEIFGGKDSYVPIFIKKLHGIFTQRPFKHDKTYLK